MTCAITFVCTALFSRHVLLQACPFEVRAFSGCGSRLCVADALPAGAAAKPYRRRVARRARRGTRGEGDTARAMARMPEQGAVVVDLVDNEQPHLDLEAIREAMHEAQRQRRGSRGSRRREHDQRGGASRKGAHAAMRRRGCLMQPRPGF